MPVGAGEDEKADQWELSPESLGLNLPADELGFQTTNDLEPLEGLIGQERATGALRWGWRSGIAATTCSSPGWPDRTGKS